VLQLFVFDQIVVAVILIRPNSEICYSVTVGKVSHADKMRMQTLRGQGFRSV